MKKILTLLLLYIAGVNSIASAQTTTYNYTGTLQTYTVPTGVLSLSVTATGATGGSAYYSSPGGCGGRVTGVMAVTPGQVLNIYVGERGDDGSYYGGGAGGNSGPTAGCGGDGGIWYGSGGGGGGGGTDIRIGGVALSNRVIAAGGGGGGGNDCGSDDGGSGGGPGTAGDGIDCSFYNPFSCGGGALTTGGGPAALSGGSSGASFFGGDGAAYYFASGGGGGGGYYGGGGGYTGGGGGGSSYADPAIMSSVVHTAGVGCSGNGQVVITVLCSPPTGGAIVGPATLCVGSTITYTNPTGTPGGVWSSSVPSVATVNPTTGAVTGLTVGATTIDYVITLSCGSASASMPINVIATSAPITGPSSTCQGNNEFFSNTTPGGSWSSSAPAIGTIDAVTGMFTALTPGVTTIGYTVGACSSTLSFTVNPNPPAIVGPTSVCRFLTVSLSNPMPGGTWTSTVPAAATVGSSSGIVTGVGLGATNIIYTLPSGCSSPLHFMSVSQPPLPITGPNEVCDGSAIVLTQPVGGGVWSSSAPASATVTSGVVTGLAPAVVTISYTMPSCPPETHIVTVNPRPAPITGPSAVCVGMVTTLSSATPGGAWSSGDPSVTVTPAGDVTGTTAGISATIYYTLPTTCSTSTVVNVGTPPFPIVGIDSMCQGDSTTMTNATPGGIWSSTNLAIGQIIDSSGVLYGISSGVVNISYTLPTGCFAMKPFKVRPLVTGAVTLSYAPTGIVCEGDTVTITATPVNGGIPTYIWTKFTTISLSGLDSFGTLRHVPIHGDVINVFMMPHDICALSDTVADSIVMNVYPKDVLPTVTILTTGPDTAAFLGQVVTFFASVTWGGDSPTFQWFINGAPVPGATGQTFATPVYTTDTVWCEVNGNPPCTALPIPTGVSNSIIVYGTPVGVSTISNGSNDLSLFPNPNNGSFTLKGKLAVVSDNEVSYEVTNMLGQVVHSGKLMPKNGQVDANIQIENIATGSYLLRINTETGSETFHFVIGR